MTTLNFNKRQFFFSSCVCVSVAYQHLNENLAKLTAKFEKATADKLKCQQEAESTARTISLANRLVSRATAGSRGPSACHYNTQTHFVSCLSDELFPSNRYRCVQAETQLSLLVV